MAAPKDSTKQAAHLRAWQEENKAEQRRMGHEHAERINARNVDATKIRALLRKRFPGGSPQMARELNIPRSTAGHLLYGARTKKKMTPQMAERLLRICLGMPYRPFHAQKAKTKPDPVEKPWGLEQMLKDSAHLKEANYMRRQITGLANAMKHGRQSDR